MPTLTATEQFIDSGYLSGLAAQSELTRLLDEIFGSLRYGSFAKLPRGRGGRPPVLQLPPAGS